MAPRRRLVSRLAPLLSLATLATLAALAALGGTVACGQPSNKTTLNVCTPGENGCPKEDDLTAKKGSSGSGNQPTDLSTPQTPATQTGPVPTATGTNTTPTGDGDAGPTTTPVTVTPDELGPSCTRLKGCCDLFVAQGIVADFCIQALNTANENTCMDKVESYENDPEGNACPAQ